MARKIVVVLPGEADLVLSEVLAHDEEQLQQHLTEYPEMIPVEEFGWSGPMMVVGRESSLPSGAPDLVGVGPEGEILIAEFKTGPQNPDFRAAVAQAIDYGADLWGMSFDEFEEAVAVRYFNSQYCPADSPSSRATSLEAAVEATWADSWDEESQSQFRDRVEAALRDGEFHFAVVAQRFTETMESTAEYLNAAGVGAGVHLVELIRFTDTPESTDAFEARTILKPSRSGASSGGSRRSKLTLETFLEQESDTDRRAWLADFLPFCTGIRIRDSWGPAGTSLRLPTERPASIGWLFPSGVKGWMGLADLTLGYDVDAAASQPDDLVALLEDYAVSVAQLPGAVRVGSESLSACTFDTEAMVANSEAIRELLSDLVTAVFE